LADFAAGSLSSLSSLNYSITGFLLGKSLAAAYGYYYLLTNLAAQSTLLTGTIADLQASTNALQTYISKIDTLEKDIRKLEDRVVDKEGMEDVRGEFKKVVQGVRGEGLELKERLVGLGKTYSTLMVRKGCCYADEKCEDAAAAAVIDIYLTGVYIKISIELQLALLQMLYGISWCPREPGFLSFTGMHD
jgi:hypothetical protein